MYPSELGPEPGLKWWWDDHFPPNRHIDYDVLKNGSFDPDDIRQGFIGDCYLLATLMGYLRTEAGQQMIRESIRWDPKKRGYWVTLYPDGEPRESFVNQAFDSCAVEEDWRSGPFSGYKPGIAAIYESAVYQVIGYEDLADGGWPKDTMEMLTGDGRATAYHSGPDGPPDDYLFQAQWKLDDGANVVVSTYDDALLPSGEYEEITVKRVVDGRTVTDQVELGAPHAYMVDKIDDDGIWIKNPHGPGNGSDGGGAFKISKADFNKYFTSLTISGH